MEDKLSGLESLAIINQMINKAKNHFSEDGSLYLFWGWLVLCCGLGHFILEYFAITDKPWAVWFLTWAGALYMVFYLRKQRRRAIVKTYAEEMIGTIWLTFAILMVVGAVAFGRLIPEYYRYNYIYVLIMYGMPTFLSGAVLKFKPLMFGALACWVLALAAGSVDFKYHPLFIAFAVILAWIIPGYILKYRYNHQSQHHG